jgi:hypothetical protein
MSFISKGNKMSKISRRSFLKLIGAAAPAVFLPNLVSWIDGSAKRGGGSQPNFILILFDAMSARNLSVYGYPRLTSPNFKRFADHATVYHSHYSGGNYTIPGVASLLTGTYPWTNRAINYSGVVKRSMVKNNIFNAFGEDFHRLAFPQSVWANFLVSQFRADVDTLLSSGTFGELNFLLNDYFPKDKNMAVRALDDFVFKMNEPQDSIILGSLQKALYLRDSDRLDAQGYPRGLPQNVNYPLYFRLENVFDGLASLLPGLPSPFFTYLHLFPPHAPYRPSRRFNREFSDGWMPVVKQVHRFSKGYSEEKLALARQSYDRYIASLDWELGRLLDTLEDAGIFKNSYVVITSDHGEMFERGEKAHATPLLYDPIAHIPLLISAPGQTTRRDVYAPTNAVDILPTLMQLAGRPIPAWCEGKPLPGLGGSEDFERSTYTIEAKLSPALGPLTKATVALRKGSQKLIYYTGYEEEDTFELYDLDADIEEMNDLYPARPAIAKKMRDELLETFLAVNKPYMK